ncbi:MAG: rhomboid family intramembrane serine protease [Flavobacteriales bacterium]|nr:MAG: rhomboid family intramembrane serine protease [Flavobacteriales bacterium]
MNVWEEIKTWWRTGGVLLRLIIINVAVFLALLFVGLGAMFVVGPVPEGTKAGDLATLWMHQNVLPWLASTSDLTSLPFRAWTIVTYMFTHEGVLHLFFNMLMLWFSGRLFSDLLGERRLFGNYLLGGLSGFLLFLLFSNVPALRSLTDGGLILGASASVTAIFVGVAVYQPELVVRLLLFGAIRLKWLALIFLLLDLISIRNGDNSGGHIAHLGGALYGYMAAAQLKKGNDWSLGFINGLERIGSALRLRRGARLKVVKTPRGKRVSDADFNAARNAQQSNIDAILDKISRSGYESLSKAEKDILFKASNEGKR